MCRALLSILKQDETKSAFVECGRLQESAVIGKKKHLTKSAALIINIWEAVTEGEIHSVHWPGDRVNNAGF